MGLRVSRWCWTILRSALMQPNWRQWLRRWTGQACMRTWVAFWRPAKCMQRLWMPFSGALAYAPELRHQARMSLLAILFSLSRCSRQYKAKAAQVESLPEAAASVMDNMSLSSFLPWDVELSRIQTDR